MKAIIPAAGYATRLYPLTIDKPKALLDISGRPIIEYILEKILEIKDVNEIIIVTNDKFYKVFLSWSMTFSCPVTLKILNDGTKSNEDRLGTIGDIMYSIKESNIHEDFIVVNSDNIFSFDLRDFHKTFLEKGESLVSAYDVNNIDIAKHMGSVQIDSMQKVTSFIEKDPNVKSTLCSVGIYLFPGYVTRMIEVYLQQGNAPDRSGDFIAWLYKHVSVHAHIFKSEESWFDIGSLESYNEAQKIFGDKGL